MAQTKKKKYIARMRPALCGGKKGRTYKQVDNVDDFTINLVITVIVLLIGLALVRGEND